MNRQSVQRTATFAATEGAATSIDYDSYAGGVYYVPSGTDVTVTWYGSVNGESFYPAYDSEGVSISQTVSSGRVYAIPDGLFGCKAIKAVGGSAIAGVILTLKS